MLKFPFPDIPSRMRFLTPFLLAVCSALLVTGLLLETACSGGPHPVNKNSHSTVPIASRMPEHAKTPENPPVKFIAFGDSGSGTPTQRALGQQMYRQYQADPFSFVLMLGDNIYEDGDIKNLGHARFTVPYQELLENHVPFYPVLGNHDVRKGFENDQLEFFGMPGRYYSFIEGNVQFFALDTNRFDAAQKAWLENCLSKSKAPWKIVYGHHPLFSSGEHGNSPALIKTLLPLLEKYGVSLYLAGHDHDYERFNAINGVTFVVSGGGGAYLRKFGTPKPGSRVRIIRHHFMVLNVQGNTLYAKVLDKDGTVLDTFEIRQESKEKLAPAA